VHHTDAELFTGVLRAELDPTGTADETRLADVLDATSSGDILDALPDGLDTMVEERGRSLSGGQRQRLAVARSLLADPEILVLVEPTSAVDAHTEAHIADRLRKIRAAKTTVVMSTSPLVLARVDEVAYLANGSVADRGTHAQLLERNADYRALVTRGEDM
jgi:ABC-type multidrug transport system fused ATPase/permease subunit